MFRAIKNQFATDDVVIKKEGLYKVTLKREYLFELIRMLKERYEFGILNAITCTDWIEDGHFALIYILSTLNRKETIMVETFISREKSTMPTLSRDFLQAQIMERDLSEMYGIDFIGNENLKELSLENWVHTPPLRREFDTLKFVNEHLSFRDGRDDNIDVKVEMKRLRALKKAKKEQEKKAKESKDGE